MSNEKILEFWNSRAKEETNVGTGDFILKGLELDLLLSKVIDGGAILDIGCGDGESLSKLVDQKGCTGRGIDFAAEMVARAQERTKDIEQISFEQGQLPGLPEGLGEFDQVITERCLINLADHKEQSAAFEEIMTHVKPGGSYLMIESFIQGLNKINDLRSSLGLDIIKPPWHNVFLDEDHVQKWQSKQYSLEEIIHFSSTYYFLSRVVYAKLAKDKGEELRYDSEINLLSAKLPIVGDFGPARMYVWKKTG